MMIDLSLLYNYSGIPYQTLINLYLGDCAKNRRELKLAWK